VGAAFDATRHYFCAQLALPTFYPASWIFESTPTASCNRLPLDFGPGLNCAAL